MNPYIDTTKENNTFVRSFYENVDELELVWHRDRESRKVQVLEGEDWRLQFDDELPFNLVVGECYYIEKNRFHRLLRGSGNLKVRITFVD